MLLQLAPRQSQPWSLEQASDGVSIAPGHSPPVVRRGSCVRNLSEHDIKILHCSYYINLMDNITQLYAAVCWFLFSTHCFKEAVPPHFTSDSPGLKAMLWAVRCSGIPGSSAVLLKPLDGLLMPLPSHSSLIFWPPISSPRIKSIAQSAYLYQINPNHSSFDAIGPFRQFFCYICLP